MYLALNKAVGTLIAEPEKHSRVRFMINSFIAHLKTPAISRILMLDPYIEPYIESIFCLSQVSLALISCLFGVRLRR